ncbi:MAG: DUF6115 domain-containing protein [Eubacteriales bacterium]|nr:DUF6115 domain-containing protein [Eubacteriales bacterium]
MTTAVLIMIIIGIIFIFASFFITEKLTKKQENFNADLLTVTDSYEFSERERNLIKRKIEDVIAHQAKDILYETNESLSNMANEKTLALGDYAVTVCEEIERNHKEVMFLYSMLDDKQKEIMNTVKSVDETKSEMKDTLLRIKDIISKLDSGEKKKTVINDNIENKISVEKKLMERKTEDVVQNHENASTNEKENLPTEEGSAISEKKVADELDDVLFEDIKLEKELDHEFEKNVNSNDIILEMYKNGDNIITIAKELGLGVGEVKLVIDLYQGE